MFKVGDKIICIDTSMFEDSLTLGKEYKVLSILSNPENEVFFIAIKEDSGIQAFFNNKRFKLKENT